MLFRKKTYKLLNHKESTKNAVGLTDMKKAKRQIKTQNESALVDWFLTIDIDALGNTA